MSFSWTTGDLQLTATGQLLYGATPQMFTWTVPSTASFTLAAGSVLSANQFTLNGAGATQNCFSHSDFRTGSPVIAGSGSFRVQSWMYFTSGASLSVSGTMFGVGNQTTQGEGVRFLNGGSLTLNNLNIVRS